MKYEIKKKDSLGIEIPESEIVYYLERNNNQDLVDEFFGIIDFINLFLFDNRNKYRELSGNNLSVDFINYGSTQLVFVITIDSNKHYTILVNQPATKFGTGKREFDNLRRLNVLNGDYVINPRYYYTDGTHELYLTPYMYQSRCIGIDEKDWGVWVPEPEYHFRSFSGLERKAINSVIVALLIKFYDEEKNEGIAKCRLDGGDFMIAKGYEKHNTDPLFILKNIRLIAARQMIPIDLNSYIERIREEFSGKVNPSELIILGEKLRANFSDDEIEKGIELGLKLRNNEEYKKTNLMK